MTLTFVDKKLETSNIYTFYFTPSEKIAQQAGQHISMRLIHENPDSRGMVRQFTLSSAPGAQMLSITTREGTSSFKKALFNLIPGQTIDARGPGGLFTLAHRKKKMSTFIAGGIGITPVVSILRDVVKSGEDGDIFVLYSARSRADFVFKEELDQIAQAHPSVHLWYTITGEHTSLWNGSYGRIDQGHLRAQAPVLAQGDVYISGPKQFVDDMVTLVTSLGVSSELVHTESFPGY